MDYSKWHWECLIRELIRFCPEAQHNHLYSHLYCLREDVKGVETFPGSYVFQVETLSNYAAKKPQASPQLIALVAEMRERGKHPERYVR